MGKNSLDLLSVTINAADMDENFNPFADEPIKSHTLAPTLHASKLQQAPATPPNPHLPASSPPTPVLQIQLVEVVQKWIPTKLHTTFLTETEYLEFLLEMWSKNPLLTKDL